MSAKGFYSLTPFYPSLYTLKVPAGNPFAGLRAGTSGQESTPAGSSTGVQGWCRQGNLRDEASVDGFLYQKASQPISPTCKKRVDLSIAVC